MYNNGNRTGLYYIVIPYHIPVLRKLDITHNNLKGLPHIMGEMRKLQILHAQHNDIEDLPNFEGCEHIQELHFGNNYIKVYFIFISYSYK